MGLTLPYITYHARLSEELEDMPEPNDLDKISTHCDQLANSPYLRKQLPPELKNLRSVVDLAGKLTQDEVPALIAEVKRLRSQNKKLQEENQTLRASQTAAFSQEHC